MTYKLYVVRMIDNREIVGVYAARDNDELVDLIDQCVSPTETEWRRLKNGFGVYWPGHGAPSIPTPVDDDEDCDPTGMILTDGIDDPFLNDGKWTKTHFDFARWVGAGAKVPDR